MPFPLLALGAGAIAKKFARKAAGTALRALTGGRLIGAGGGAIAARRAVGAATGIVTAREVYRAVSPPSSPQGRRVGPNAKDRWPGDDAPYRTYRRMNPMNVRALRKAVRRISAAEKLFRQVFTISGGKVTPRTKRR